MSQKSRDSRPNLLLVDDCIPQRDLYELVLAPDFRVATASRGADGVELAITQPPDVVVLDVLMPEMDGWEACTRIKSHPTTADVPVILLTASDDHDLSQHATAVGAAALLNKPCPAETLRKTIFAVLSNTEKPRDRSQA